MKNLIITIAFYYFVINLYLYIPYKVNNYKAYVKGMRRIYIYLYMICQYLLSNLNSIVQEDTILVYPRKHS